MATTPTIIWTALPNGFAGFPKLSIFVSPRLDDPTGSTLADYTLGNWPQRVLSLAQGSLLAARVGPGAGPVFQVAVDVSNLRPDLWDALLPSTTPVSAFQFRDHSLRPIRSYSTRAIHDFIEATYTAVANASPSDYPDINAKNEAGSLVSMLGASMDAVRKLASVTGANGPNYIPPLPPGLDAASQAGTHPDAAIEAQLIALAAGSNVPLAEFYRAYRFYNRGQQEVYRSQFVPRVVSDIPAPLVRPKFDFHQVVAALGDHPVVLRALGLIIDGLLITDVAELSIFSQIQVQVSSALGLPATPNDQTPWTAYDTATFLPRPAAGSDLGRGLLSLGNTNTFSVFQADVDGHALRTLDFAVNMQGLLKQRLAEVANGCNPLGVAPNPTTHKEPQSLPALRNGGITVARSARDTAVYQGFVNAKTNNVDPSSAVLYYDDVLRGYRVDVQYRGAWYSLCQRKAQYSIQSISLTPAPDEGFVKAVSATSAVKDPPSGPPAQKDLYLHEAVFGWNNWSLVVPRPGRSVSYQRNDTDRTQTAVVQQETNPPDPDFPLQITTQVPAKSLPPLRFGETYTLRARAVDLAGNGPPLATPNGDPLLMSAPVTYLRYEPVAAPAVVLRAPLTPGESAEHLVIRSKVGSDAIANETTIFNTKCERHIAPPKTSQRMAELHGEFDPYFANPDAAYAIAVRESGTFSDPGGDVQLINGDGMIVDPAPLKQRGEALPNGYYVIHTSDQPALPYLPDPLAKGVGFQAPGVSLIGMDFKVTDTWPNLTTFRLVMVAEPGVAPTFDVSNLVTVRVPKGTILTLRYSSIVRADKLPLMARWVAMSAVARTATQATGYQHWMITPYREVTFVHAVEKPMSPPVVAPALAVSRTLGDTFATLKGSIDNHAPSTGQLDLFAAWSEMVDRVQLPAAAAEARTGRIFDRKIGYDESTVAFPDPKQCETVRHEFGDTKHRWVKYHGLATTRYREYFPTVAQNPALITLAGPETNLVDIPSSARPIPPRVLYILPTFQWQLSSDKTTSTRVGRGLRVYVDRPWYSSGDDELLGVIVPPSGTFPDELRKYISEWGSDPVWDSTGPSTEMAPEHFVSDSDQSKPTVLTGLSLAELDPNQSDMWVTAVGIAPQYNADRQLYYFDIVLDPGDTYFPFVRLALARLQPHSLTDAYLSRVVRADFAQLVADRTATITYNGKTSVDVVVAGITAKNELAAQVQSGMIAVAALGPGGGMVANPSVGKGHLVRAFVQSRTDPKQGDLGWKTVGAVRALSPYSVSIAPSTAYWRGTVTLPGTIGDGAEYRLAVEELEIYETDSASAESGLEVTTANNVPVRSRLVYFDALPLSP